MKIGSLRGYLLTIIDFFSRLIIAFDVVPMVNASHIKVLSQRGLRALGIPLGSASQPEHRMDQGSPTTARMTQEIFESLGATLSIALVRRPTDNAIMERFYGTIKQEEIYWVGTYADEQSAREELGRSITYYYYNLNRPHQGVWNFTPEYVHEVNNKTRVEAKGQLNTKTVPVNRTNETH